MEFNSKFAHAVRSLYILSMRTAGEWITALGLIRHPEGGYFRETYRSSDSLNVNQRPAQSRGSRPISTAIYYLLQQGDVSRFHRLKSDEVWHFYDGNSLAMYVLQRSGSLAEFVLGTNLGMGERPQAVVRAGDWVAAAVEAPGSYSLVGCTVAPGFLFEDLELAHRDSLLDAYPEYHDLILRLT